MKQRELIPGEVHTVPVLTRHFINPLGYSYNYTDSHECPLANAFREYFGMPSSRPHVSEFISFVQLGGITLYHERYGHSKYIEDMKIVESPNTTRDKVIRTVTVQIPSYEQGTRN